MERVPRAQASPTASGDRGVRGFLPGGSASALALLLVGFPIARFLITDAALRVSILRCLLSVIALAEALAFLSQELRPRRFAERNGRPYDAAYHGVMQDFGFYNLGFALLLGFAAMNPEGSRITIGVLIASYAAHAATHFLRYLGVYFGGGHPIPTRPPAFEARDGLQLAVAAAGMLAFFP